VENGGITQRLTGYIRIMMVIENSSDNIDENGKPKLANWRLCIFQTDKDEELQSVEIKTEQKSYLIIAEKGIAKIINLPQDLYSNLISLNEEQLHQMKEIIPHADSIINILDIGSFKMRLNFRRGSLTLPENSIKEIKDYCAGFLKDINVDVRSVLINDTEQKSNVEVENGRNEKFPIENNDVSQKSMSFYRKSKIKFYLGALVFIFVMTVALHLSVSIFLLMSLALTLYMFVIDRK
jgi:hypothetical protein